MELIKRNMAQIIALCEKYKVKDLYAFGSILTGRFNDNSDVDLVVVFDRESFSPEEYAANFFGLQFALEDLFCRSVDLVEYEAIRNPYFKDEVDETKRAIYGTAA